MIAAFIEILPPSRWLPLIRFAHNQSDFREIHDRLRDVVEVIGEDVQRHIGDDLGDLAIAVTVGDPPPSAPLKFK
jgi:hypothetical protein